MVPLQVGYPLVTVLVCLVDASNYSSLVDSMADFLAKQMKNKEYRSAHMQYRQYRRELCAIHVLRAVLPWLCGKQRCWCPCKVEVQCVDRIHKQCI